METSLKAGQASREAMFDPLIHLIWLLGVLLLVALSVAIAVPAVYGRRRMPPDVELVVCLCRDLFRVGVRAIMAPLLIFGRRDPPDLPPTRGSHPPPTNN